MTSRAGHRHPPLQRTSVSGRILSAGLATATCIGVVGLLGARTIDASAESNTEPADPTPAAVAAASTSQTATVEEPRTSSGLTEADLDAYAAALAKEKQRLDDYRTRLLKTAKKLTRQAARLSAASKAAKATASSGSAGSAGTAGQAKAPAKSSSPSKQQAKPAAKPAAKPVAKPAAKPAPKPAPKQQSAPAPQQQTTTKGS